MGGVYACVETSDLGKHARFGYSCFRRHDKGQHRTRNEETNASWQIYVNTSVLNIQGKV